MKFISLIFLFSTPIILSGQVLEKKNFTDTITIFDLTVNEEYGCISHDNFYKNFHFEKDTFSITYSDDQHKLLKQNFNKDVFKTFYDSLNIFDLYQITKRPIKKSGGSATGFGLITIEINGKKTYSMLYQTLPDDSTNFMFAHQWLQKKAVSISSYLDINLLLSTNFQLINNISSESVVRSIKDNINNFDKSCFFRILDTAKNLKFRKVIIQSLSFIKDEEVLIYCGNILQTKCNEEDVNAWMDDEKKFVLNTILTQNNCDIKTKVLKGSLMCKSNFLKLHSAVALAEDNMDDGIEIIFDNIQKSIHNRNPVFSIMMEDELIYSITRFKDSSVLKKLIVNYEYLINSNYVANSKIYNLICHIIAINLILDSKYDCTHEEFRSRCLAKNKGKSIPEEIHNLNERLKADPKAKNYISLDKLKY